MSVLGITAAEEELYRLVLRNSGEPVERVARLHGTDPDRLLKDLGHLVGLGLVATAEDRLSAAPPERAVGRLLSEETRRLRSASEQLEAVRGLLPSLNAEHLAGSAPKGEPVVVESIPVRDVVDMIRSLSAASTGDLLWLRPDQWRLQAGRETDEWVKQLIASGRRSRVIYPARALEEAPEVIHSRADTGENVRILASLPVRLAILGGAGALIQGDWHATGGDHLVIRHPGIVSSLRLLFECLWERAMPVPGLDGQDGDRGDRKLMLDQLAAGAKDEQIARALGLSVRTVRRRVAEILDDLGVESRFQAGVEAVRRGWI